MILVALGDQSHVWCKTKTGSSFTAKIRPEIMPVWYHGWDWPPSGSIMVAVVDTKIAGRG